MSDRAATELVRGQLSVQARIPALLAPESLTRRTRGSPPAAALTLGSAPHR